MFKRRKRKFEHLQLELIDNNNNEPSIIFSLQNYNTEYTPELPSGGKLLYTANHFTYHVKIQI